ncbi:MAG TPA: M50 family metallopeptidase [Kofleriaceae bacterium]
MFWFYVAALFSLAFLIVVHEAGHYFVARRCGMKIERFSIGFGPGILKRKSKKTGTTFQIAPIPFGGFVEIRGMNIAEDVDPDDRAAYPNRPTWQRFITIFAGPATNYLSAIVVMFVLYATFGMQSTWGWYGVAEVKDTYDAHGKLDPGDRILAVDHQPLLARGDHDGVHADSLVKRINAKAGQPVTLTIERDGKRFDVDIQPKLAKDDAGKELLQDGKPYYLVGIVPTEQTEFVDVPLSEAAANAAYFPIDQTVFIASQVRDIFSGKVKADPRGPKGIFDEFAKAWKLGPFTGLYLVAALSVYLGLFNLLPIPALDGGRLVFLLYEMVTRRRANPKIEAMVHMAGIMVLGVVMILVTMRDFGVFS